jgi:CubicO group peptidase (beta-lactamase class C family)
MTALTARTSAALTRIVAERQSKHRVPGISAAVARKGEVIWSGSAGVASLDGPEPPGPDTQFLIASISKTFTAVLVMGLRDAGKLSLDDTVDMLIPESKHGGITVRQLLSHVSGMQREPVGDVWEVFRFPDREALVAGWNEAERIGKPHHRWHYSNLAYSILGEIVARSYGESWYDVLRARVLEPLGLRRTTLGLSGIAATGYYVPPFSDVPVVEPVLDIAAMASAGALASTTTDLAAWSQFLAEGNDEVLVKDTLDEMSQPQIMADLESWQLAWGLGFMLVRVGDRIFAGHTGGMPGHITGVFVHRASSTAGIGLMNATSAPDPAALATDLAVEVLDNDPLQPEPWVAGTAVPDELAGLLGTWFSEGQGFTFSVRQGVLEARQAKAPESKPPSVFSRIGADLYRTDSGGEAGELLRVTRDESGVPVKLNWATYLFTREPYAFGEWLD